MCKELIVGALKIRPMRVAEISTAVNRTTPAVRRMLHIMADTKQVHIIHKGAEGAVFSLDPPPSEKVKPRSEAGIWSQLLDPLQPGSFEPNETHSNY